MKKVLFYDCEIKNCIPEKYSANDPRYNYCNGWDDFKGMGIACVAVYVGWLDWHLSFLENELDKFQALVDEADEVIGFNSISFDDHLLEANGVRIKTTYDLLCETRVAAGMPPHYVYSITRAGYSLEQMAQANLGRGKSGSGELAPKLWQDERREEVLKYCLDDVDLLVRLWEQRSHLVDPTNDNILFLKGGNRLTWLKAKAAQWLKKRQLSLAEAWKYSDWRIFLWAITNSDVSDCKIGIGARTRSFVRITGKGMAVQIGFPEIYVKLPTKVIRDFEEKSGEDTLSYPF